MTEEGTHEPWVRIVEAKSPALNCVQKCSKVYVFTFTADALGTHEASGLVFHTAPSAASAVEGRGHSAACARLLQHMKGGTACV